MVFRVTVEPPEKVRSFNENTVAGLFMTFVIALSAHQYHGEGSVRRESSRTVAEEV
jgi:hypothetical protein